jgi:hypothetical protein
VQNNGMVCGQKLREGLRQGQLLPLPIFTPTTKAPNGEHDLPLDVNDVARDHGADVERFALRTFAFASEVAGQAGLILLDTKIEIARRNGRIVLCDEIFTPDSSRYADEADYAEAQSQDPPRLPLGLDKQVIRDLAAAQGFNTFDPKNPDHIALVQAWEVPEEALVDALERYRYLFWRLTGMKLEQFQKEHLGMTDACAPTVHIDVICDAPSSNAQVREGLQLLHEVQEQGEAVVARHALNGRDHLLPLVEWLIDLPDTPRVIIAADDMLHGLPGTINAVLRGLGRKHIQVIGVSLAGPDGRDVIVEQLAQMPPLFGQLRGGNTDHLYGAEGFSRACDFALHNEFLSRSWPKAQAAHFGLSPL